MVLAWRASWSVRGVCVVVAWRSSLSFRGCQSWRFSWAFQGLFVGLFVESVVAILVGRFVGDDHVLQFCASAESWRGDDNAED